MPRGPQEKLLIEARRLKVTELLLRGIANRKEIARLLGLTYRVVEKDVSAIFAEWRVLNRERAKIVRDRHLAELEWQRREAVEQWEKSKLEKVRSSATRKETASGLETTATQTKEGQTGDPAFLQVLLKVQEREAELFGLPLVMSPFENDLDAGNGFEEPRERGVGDEAEADPGAVRDRSMHQEER